MATVVIGGVAVIDFVFFLDTMPRAAEKYRARDAAIVGGGCAATAAVAVARLGGDARLVTRLGDDEVAEMIVAGLEADGVDCGLVRRFAGRRSSFSSIFVDAAGERQIVNYRDLGLGSDADWVAATLPERFDAALADTRWPAGAAAVLGTARARGLPAVLDAEEPVREAEAALAVASHIAFSAQGLADFARDGAGGGESHIGRRLRQARAATGAIVCVTDGADGVYHLDGDTLVHTPAYAVEVVDTLGAGDTWHGAFALRLAEGAGEAEAIRFASAVAAIKCSRRGGRAGIPTRAETEAFMKERATCS